MKLHELINQGAKYGRLSFWERFEYIELGSMTEMNLTQYQIDSNQWEEFDINGPKCYCEALEDTGGYYEYKKKVLIAESLREDVKMVIDLEGKYRFCVTGEEIGFSDIIKYCPFCGRKLA